MNFAVKLSCFTLALSLPFFVSCDGSPPEELKDPAQDLSGQAISLNSLENGDRIFYNSHLLGISGTELIPSIEGGDGSGPNLINLLEFGAENNIDPDTGSAQVPITYLKTGSYNFNISFSNSDLQRRYNEAISILLGDLDSVFRQRLLDPDLSPEPSFSRIELESFARDFRSVGAFVFVHPDEDILLALDGATIDHYITSTNSEFLRGSIDGTFSTEFTGRVIYFRRANSADIASIRNLTPSHWVPVLGQELINVQEFQSGLFELVMQDDLNVSPPN